MVQLTHMDWWIAGIFGILPVFFLGIHGILALVPLLLLAFGLTHFFRKKIGGVTGDCLGASQQLSEILFYIIVIV